MNLKTKILAATASAAILAMPAAAQIAVGTEVETGVTATTPPTPDLDQSMDAVQDTVNQATDDVQNTVDTVTPDANPNATTEAQATASVDGVVPATAADIQAGAEVRDMNGGAVGTVESMDAAGVVVSTGTVRAQLPVASFGKDDQGLVVTVSRAEIEAAAGGQATADTQ